MGRRGLPRAAVACLVTALGACGGGDGERAASSDPAGWRPWTLSSPGEIRVPPPPRSRSAEAEASRRATDALRSRRGDPITRASVARWTARPTIGPWQEVAMRFVSRRTKDPPAGSRAYALVGVAAHDAMVAAAHWRDVHGRPGHPSTEAAMAGAAAAVLAHAFPEHPKASLDAMAEEAADAHVVHGTTDRAGADAGLALGRAVAGRVVARVRGDRVHDGPRVDPPRGRGMWAPPPGSTARPVQPEAGRWATWLLERGDAVRPPAPPDFDSTEFRAEAREVVEVKKRLTPEQEEVARFWEGGEGTELPPGIWVRAVLAHLRERKVDDAMATRAIALLTTAMSDAGVAAWDAKYLFWTPRPENAIRDLGIDRDWEPLLETPLFPAYPSGHATYSGAAGEILAHLFPEQRETWRTRAQEAADSRVYGGIHYRMDGSSGLEMGRRIGRLAVRRAQGDGAG